MDELLATMKDPSELLGGDGLMKQLIGRMVEKSLKAELTEHLGYRGSYWARMHRTEAAGRPCSRTQKGYCGAGPGWERRAEVGREAPARVGEPTGQTLQLNVRISISREPGFYTNAIKVLNLRLWKALKFMAHSSARTLSSRCCTWPSRTQRRSGPCQSGSGIWRYNSWPSYLKVESICESWRTSGEVRGTYTDFRTLPFRDWGALPDVGGVCCPCPRASSSTTSA